MSNEKIVSFNVGGMIFTTFRTTIAAHKESALYSIMNSEINTTDKKGNIFLDRDPQIFRHLLYFLRTGSLEYELTTNKLEDLWKEADFFQLERCMQIVSQELKNREWSHPGNWRLSSQFPDKKVIILMYSVKQSGAGPSVNMSQSLKFETSIYPNRKVLYKLKGAHDVIDCMGQTFPGLIAARNRTGGIDHRFTSSDKIKNLPPKSVFFWVDRQGGDICLLKLMQMDHMIHSDWLYYWDRTPSYTNLKAEECNLEIWAPNVSYNKQQKQEPPTK